MQTSKRIRIAEMPDGVDVAFVPHYVIGGHDVTFHLLANRDGDCTHNVAIDGKRVGFASRAFPPSAETAAFWYWKHSRA